MQAQAITIELHALFGVLDPQHQVIESIPRSCRRNWSWWRYNVLTSDIWPGWQVLIVRYHGVVVSFDLDNR
jgi:hypothetical protein